MASNYEQLVKALRICSSELNCGDCPLLYRDSCSSDKMMADAAAAIEALQAEVQFYKALADEWQSSAENKERLLGLYRAEQAKHFYSAMNDNGQIIANPCAYTNIPVFPDCSENPNG